MSNTFQLATSIISISSNFILLLLIWNKSPKKLGVYKYLMLFFTFHSIFFSIMEMISKPQVLSFGTCFVVFMNRRNSLFPFEIDMFFLCVMCGCCGVTMYTSAVHFMFRYWAVERKGHLDRFKGYRLILWLMIPIIVGIIWGFAVFFGLHVNEETFEYVESKMMSTYGLEFEDIVIVGAFFYSTNSFVHYQSLTGILVLALIMISSISIIVYFGIKIFRQTGELYKKGGFKGTKRLQTQLYKALVVQTFLPVIILFFPLGLFFFLPLICIDIGVYSQIANYTTAIYPALEPLPLLIIIDDYRHAIWKHLRLIMWKKLRGNRVQPEVTTISASLQSGYEN